MAAQKPEELVRMVEAVLFSYGKRVNIDEIARLCRMRNNFEPVKEALALLKQEYDEKNNALMVVQDGDHWKLTTRERFHHVVSRIVPHTELSKTVMETLAILAWKAPMRQSELIEIRTNKAYDHVTELVDSGFISKEKYGRTYLLKLTQKFFDYFDLKNTEEAHKMFDKILPEKEKKELEQKLQAAKEAVDAREAAEQMQGLPKVEQGKYVNKATLASDLIAAAKSIKIQRDQPQKEAVVENKDSNEGNVYQLKEEKDEIKDETKNGTNENTEDINEDVKSNNHESSNVEENKNDLEDDIAEDELIELEEELPDTKFDEKKEIAKPDED